MISIDFSEPVLVQGQIGARNVVATMPTGQFTSRLILITWVYEG
jgi:hypothetical protein